jgi:hypothetical protein
VRLHVLGSKTAAAHATRAHALSIAIEPLHHVLRVYAKSVRCLMRVSAEGIAVTERHVRGGDHVPEWPQGAPDRGIDVQGCSRHDVAVQRSLNGFFLGMKVGNTHLRGSREARWNQR